MLRWLDLTLESPALNLALDEALLDRCEEDAAAEALRFWESPAPFVVLGRSSDAEADVDLAACRARGIAVLRRSSGGGTVLLGPGCLNYAVALRSERRPELRGIDSTNAWVMERHRSALSPLAAEPLRVEGVTDLTLAGRKVSGNAQRRRRRALLFHGTFLYAFDVDLAGAVLRLPAKRPAYRGARPHHEFLARLPLSRERIAEALRSAWGAGAALSDPPIEEARRLAAVRCAEPHWTVLPIKRG